MSAPILGLRLEPVVSASGREFLETYGALAGEFGPRGELERREVVEHWLEGRLSAEAPLRHVYRLLALRDGGGALVGVRDVHLVTDPAARIVVAYLAHALVLPPFRRRGAGAMLRAAPIALARRAAHDAGLGDDARLLLAAEMEPPKDDDPASLTRLVAYGRDGFAAIAEMPYFQPDFSDPRARSGAPRPLRLLPVVKEIPPPVKQSAHGTEQGARDETPARLDAALARAFVVHLYGVFATHVAKGELAPLLARSLAALEGRDTLALVPLPTSTEPRAAFDPLRFAP